MRKHRFRPSQCFVLLNSRIPVACTSSDSFVDCQREEHADQKGQRTYHHGVSPQAASSLPPRKSTLARSVGQSPRIPESPNIGANPFPKITDLFCRLPLCMYIILLTRGCSIWDQLRLWVRPGVRISHPWNFYLGRLPSPGFSGTITGVPKPAGRAGLYRPFIPYRRTNRFQGEGRVNQERNLCSELVRTSRSSVALPHFAVTTVSTSKQSFLIF